MSITMKLLSLARANCIAPARLSCRLPSRHFRHNNPCFAHRGAVAFKEPQERSKDVSKQRQDEGQMQRFEDRASMAPAPRHRVFDMFRSMEREIEDMMRGFTPFSGPAALSRAFDTDIEPFFSRRVDFMPMVDVHEDEKKLYISADVPGMDKDDIKLRVHNGVLTMSGERSQETKSDEAGWHRVERSYGTFQRQFRLPQSVDPDSIQAKVENGVLNISMDKKDETTEEGREIEVQSA